MTDEEHARWVAKATDHMRRMLDAADRTMDNDEDLAREQWHAIHGRLTLAEAERIILRCRR